MSYTLRTDKTWAATYDELQTQFQRWNVRDWEVRSLGRVSRATYQDRETRLVTLRWTSSDGHEIRLEMADQDRAVDNLRVLFLVVEAMRLNEARGIGRVIAEAYAMLAPPKTKRDPFEVLGVRSDTDMDVVEAAYRAKAKTAHPDAGGTNEAMAELNEALDEIRRQRGVAA